MSIDKIVKIIDVELGGAELTDGEHILLAAAADNSYVITEYYVETDWLTGVELTINDFPIPYDATINLVGALKVPAGTTLKLKTDLGQYPLSGIEFSMNTFKYLSWNVVEEKARVINGVVETASDSGEQETSTINLASLSSSDTKEVKKIGSSFYQVRHDSNAGCYVYYWATEASARTTLSSGSYMLAHIVDDGVVWFESGGYLKKHTPGGGTVTLRNGIDVPDDTYPRSCLFMGWLFYLRGSDETNVLRAINVNTGAFCQFNGLTAIANYSLGTKIWVSYDEATDKFHIYRSEENSTPIVYRAIPNDTVTAMNAYANNSNNTPSSTSTSFEYTSLSNFGDANFRSHPVGSDVNGDEFYYLGESSPFNKIYKATYQVQGEELLGSFEGDKTTFSQAVLNMRTLDAAAIDAIEFDRYFGIKILALGVHENQAA